MKEHIQNAISDLIENNLENMRTNFNNALMSKAVEKLEEKKVEIAQSYFESK